MRKYLPLVLVIGLLSVFALPRPCAACSCTSASVSATPAETLARSDAVFRGRVTVISRGWNLFRDFGGSYQRVTFRVDESWKGPTTREIVVNTGLGGGDCGYSFAGGQEYLVYASNNSGTPQLPAGLRTSICDRTKPLGLATDDLRALGPGAATAAPPPRNGGEYGKFLPQLAAVVVSLLTAGLVLWTRLLRARGGAEEAARRWPGEGAA